MCISPDEPVFIPDHGPTVEQGFLYGVGGTLFGKHQGDRPVASFVRFVVPIDEVVNVGAADEGEVVVQGNLEGVLREGTAVGNFDAVEQPVPCVVLVKF